MAETIEGTDGVVAYLLVFVLAATPWLEILLVIPPAIGLGLDPLLVTTVAFVGNVVTVLVVIWGYARIMSWLRDRRDIASSARWNRAQRLWNRYGLPVLAILAPLVTGSHLGAVLAVSFGASRHRVAVWMIGSLLAWSIALGVLTVGGLSVIDVVR